MSTTSGVMPSTVDTHTSRAHPTPTFARRLTPPQVMARKGKEPIVMLTAYTARMAQLLDPHVDVLLVGDSLAQVVYGLPSTLPVTLDMMIAHGAAVVRGSAKACVVVDMPFGSYEAAPEIAFENAARVLAQTGASAVKLEGGAVMAETIAFLVQRGVPVMGHVGLTPQAINTLGGYGARGKSQGEYAKILDDARSVSEAGAFALVIEGVVEKLAIEITRATDCPSIGIGASAQCDGQVLVVDDMLGIFDRVPRFVEKFDELGTRIDVIAGKYAEAVRARRFPGAANLYQPVTEPAHKD
jgi:3-methyl-2-oxobutanoate hydroxymethyltransferase